MSLLRPARLAAKRAGMTKNQARNEAPRTGVGGIFFLLALRLTVASITNQEIGVFRSQK